MLDQLNQTGAQTEALVAQIKNRARNLYLTRQFMCAEAVLVTLNQGLGGGLSEAQAVAMAAPFSAAMGESGCICGALSGAVLACGLFLGDEQPYRHRKEMRNSARQLHDMFKMIHGATCCRVLIRKIKQDQKAHFQHCGDLTAETTACAARLILNKRPQLVTQAGNGSNLRRDTIPGGKLNRLWRYFST